MTGKQPPPRVRAIAVAALVLAAAGCGGSGELPPQDWPGAAEQVLVASDVEAYPAGSPERVLFDWWRHGQNMEYEGFMRHFATDVRRELEATGFARRALPDFAFGIRTSRPRVVETEVDGRRATIWTRVESRNPIGLTRYVSSDAPHAFPLVREDGTWRLANDFFLRTVVRNVERGEGEEDGDDGGADVGTETGG